MRSFAWILVLAASGTSYAAKVKVPVYGTGVSTVGGYTTEQFGTLTKDKRGGVLTMPRYRSLHGSEGKSPNASYRVLFAEPSARSKPLMLWSEGVGTAFYGDAIKHALFNKNRRQGLKGLSQLLDKQKHPVSDLGKVKRGQVVAFPIDTANVEVYLRRVDGEHLGKYGDDGVRGDEIAAVKSSTRYSEGAGWGTRWHFGPDSMGFTTDADGKRHVLIQLADQKLKPGQYEIFVQHQNIHGKSYLSTEDYYTSDFQRYRIELK